MANFLDWSLIPMIWLKSSLMGFLALLVAAILPLFVVPLVVAAKYGEPVGWDPTAFVRRFVFWLPFVLVFLAGFFWEYRRLKH
jgi:hypothetical protein